MGGMKVFLMLKVRGPGGGSQGSQGSQGEPPAGFLPKRGFAPVLRHTKAGGSLRTSTRLRSEHD